MIAMEYILIILAAGHGLAAAWLWRFFQLNKPVKQRHWQLASLLFPLGVIIALLVLTKRKSRP